MKTRRTQELLKGRVSLSGARYFVTCCAERPESRLTCPLPAESIRDTLDRMHADGDMSLLCATVMPDHLHLLFHLGYRLSLNRVLAKFKTLTGKTLRAENVRWQKNFFEHRLRPDDTADSYARYIFMNPFRAGLVTRKNTWPHWMLGKDADFDFLGVLDEGRFPPKEWMIEEPEAWGLQRGNLGPD